MTAQIHSMSSVEGFMPHGMCLLWQPNLLLMHVISDALIALSYYSIPVALIYFVIKRQDLSFRWLFVLFGLFILACGTTHLLNIWTIWHPDYYVEGLAKAVTAVISIITAILLWPFIPIALKIPSPSSLAHANALLQEEVLEKQRHENQVRLLNRELEKKVEARTVALQDANHNLKQEIEERQQAERALRESEEQLKAIVEGAADGIITIDQWGTIESVNAAIETIFGYFKEELIGQNVSCLIPGPDRDQHDSFLAKYLDTGVKKMIGSRRETKGLHKDGHEFPMDIAVTEFQRNGYYFFTAIIRDITERKQAEHALVEADRRKDEFLAMLGHELRNPLTPIATATEILHTLLNNDPKLASIQDMLARNVNQIIRLVNDLLDVSRITRGLINVNLGRVGLKAILHNSFESARTLMEAKQQELELKLPDQPVFIQGDRLRLVQVFSNLINNAAKYTGTGGRIEVELIEVGSLVVVHIKDNGMGLDPELKPYVFDLFTQGERSLARSEGGLGIGLTLVKKLVALHGGQISAFSAGHNQGSTFSVSLPKQINENSPEETEKQENTPLQSKEKLTILLIDDNPDVLTSISLWLKSSGHRIETASDGNQGIKVAKELAPDVVIVDIGLPDIDGYQVAQKLREYFTNKPLLIIALSGYGPDKDDRKQITSGIDHYLIKLADLNQLLRQIDDFAGTTK
jgi:PAS domain S-box-containing protein